MHIQLIERDLDTGFRETFAERCQRLATNAEFLLVVLQHEFDQIIHGGLVKSGESVYRFIGLSVNGLNGINGGFR